jgi:hypothetical protein
MTSTIKVNTIQDSCGSALVSKCSSTITLGASGKTVALASGASQTGFGRTGTVNWCTTAKTSPFTAANGIGYFVNTSGGAVTVTLPASPSAGDIVAVNDLNGTADTNAITFGRNSSKINGGCEDLLVTNERQSTTVIYTGSTQGWVVVNDANVGGSSLASQYNVQYLVVAGGGGGGESYGGGGGGGGYRTVSSKTFAVTSGVAIPITVGGGGAHAHTGSPSPGKSGCSGSNSVFSSIISAGGGGGGFGPGSSPTATDSPGLDGGSGGGGGAPPGVPYSGAGTGNVPPVSPPQGNPGAPTASAPGAGGGGGAGAAGSGGNGGIGASFTDLGPLAPSYGTTGPAPGRYFSGGGGGYQTGTGGSGGGGNAGNASGANTGGGSGGRTSSSGNAGSGIVIIRHVTADASPSVSGGNATATCSSDTIRVFTSDGTFTP